MKKLLYLCLMLMLALALAACGGGAGGDDPDRINDGESHDLPEYEVVETGRDDIGGKMVRAVYKVIVASDVSEGQMRAASDEIIEAHTADQKICALKVQFYSDQAHVDDDNVDIGTMIWAPDGKWESYMTVFPGNYTKHQMVFEAP